MAARTWLKLMRNSFVASAVFTAAQVGVGSGLAILDWPLGFTAIRGWGQLLTWVAFIFAAGVVGGAVLGGRTLRRTRPTLSIWNRVAAAVAAAAGSAAALPLVWIPVRVHLPVIDMRAETTMTVTAGIAVLAGLLLAMAALTWRSVGACMGATVAWVWLFALTSVALAAKDHVRVSPRLGVIDVPSGHPWWASPFVMVGLAAALGVVVGSVAGWKGGTWSGIALSGVSGPALLASAYLTTGWGVSGNSEDARPYLAAMFALGAGLLASMAVASATIPHRPPPRPAKVVPPPAEQPRTAIAAMPAPLAITSYAEPAYVLEASPVEPAYRRQPAFATQSIYLPTPRPGSGDTPPPRPEPASRPDLYRHAEPASESSFEPPYEAPYEPPYDPAHPPRPSSYGATISAGGHAATVEAAVVDNTVVDGVVVASTVVPRSVIEDALIVAPSSSDTTTRSATGSAATTAAPTSPQTSSPTSTNGHPASATSSASSSGAGTSTVAGAPPAFGATKGTSTSASSGQSRSGADASESSNGSAKASAGSGSGVTSASSGSSNGSGAASVGSGSGTAPVGSGSDAASASSGSPAGSATTSGKAARASVSGVSSGGSSSTSTAAPTSTAASTSTGASTSAAGESSNRSSVGASAGAPVAQPPPVSPVPATAADLQAAAAAGNGEAARDSTGASVAEGSPGDAKQESPTSTDQSETAQSGTTEPPSDEAAAPADNGKRKGRQKDKERRPAGRRSRRGDNDSKSARGLRDNERDHIDWIDNLIKLPADPTLETRDR